MNEYQLKRSTPEQQGVRSEALMKLIEAVEQCRTQNMDQDLHSIMVLRHGTVIAEGWWKPYSSDRRHLLFSLSKSFTSTAIGFAVTEGLLTVEDPVIDYFKEECPQASGHLAEMRIKHLLSMSTGHVVDTTEFFFKREDGNWVKAFLDVPVEKEPGTHFLYNTGATYMLSVIIQKVTGLKLVDYLRPRLFEPLGICNPVWEECPKGYNTGGFGLSITTEDIARFGQLYLEKGVFKGSRILPEKWIEEATSFHFANGTDKESDWSQGYGYQFWRCRHNIYRGDGAFGQYCIVLPEQDMVIAITGGLKDMQKPLKLIWDNLLEGIADEVLPESAESGRLKEKLATLQVLMPDGQKTSDLSGEYQGSTYRLTENLFKFDAIRFEFDSDIIRLGVSLKGEKQTLEAGVGKWCKGTMLNEGKKEPVMLTGIWTEESDLLVQCRSLETPFALQFHYRFNKDELAFEAKVNVGFEETDAIKITGSRIEE